MLSISKSYFVNVGLSVIFESFVGKCFHVDKGKYEKGRCGFRQMKAALRALPYDF